MATLRNTPRPTWQFREWSWEGYRLFSSLVERLDDADLRRPSLLPGWSRAHVVAHVAYNAKALRNLAHWARTGEVTPMFSSPRQRDEEIEAGATMAPAELRHLLVTESLALVDDYDSLTPDEWHVHVRTHLGREVAMTDLPWLRAREGMIHAVDLDTGIRFKDLPQAFNAALIDDIAMKRTKDGQDPAIHLETIDARGVERVWDIEGNGPALQVSGPLASGAAWLAGRPAKELHLADGSPVAPLSPWL